MSTDAEPESEERTRWTPWALAAGLFLLLMFTVIGAGMMRGCFTLNPQQAEKDEKEKAKKEDKEKEKEKKDDVEIRFPVIQPAEAEGKSVV